jgi:hypothetical protein
MLSKDVRFSFGGRPPPSDEEAARSLLPAQNTAPQQQVAMSDDESMPSLTADSDHNHELPNGNQDWKAEDDRLLNSAHTAQASNNNRHSLNTTHHSLRKSTSYMTYDTNPLLPRATMQQEESGHGSPPQDMVQRNTTPESGHRDGTNIPPYEPHIDRSQPDLGEPFLTLTPEERDAMDAILEPVRPELQCLYETRPESLPDYNPHMRMNSYQQIIEMRLVDIAGFIQEFLGAQPEQRRGLMEMKLWYVWMNLHVQLT